MPDWQWATIKQQKVFHDSNSSDASNFSPTAAAKQHLGYSNSSFVFDEAWSSFNLVDGGKLDYIWRDKLKDSPSQYAALMSDDKLQNQKPQIHVTKGNYFGPQQPAESRNNSTGDHSRTVEDRSSKTTTTSWRTAGSEELAALVARTPRKSGDYVANCDLPPPSSEPTVTSIKQCNSVSNSTSSGSSKSAGTELLGEALCRSQTRAREAEKLAMRAFQEKDELMQLFFKEASVSFAYRQWLILLQAENMCLKMCQEAYATWSSSSNLFHAHLKLNRKRKRNGPPVHRKKQSHVLLRCTLAFALGLGLAGAGLMLGWGMGWIFFAL